MTVTDCQGVVRAVHLLRGDCQGVVSVVHPLRGGCPSMFGKGQEREISIAGLTATTGSYLMWLLSDSSTLLEPELPQV